MSIPYIGWLSVQANDMTYYLHDIHQQVKKKITNNNTKYKALVDTYHIRVVF
jgi:hypothetical protein